MPDQDADFKDDFDSDYGDEEVHVPLYSDFDLTDALPESTLVEMTTKELHNLIHQGHIDLNPPYQRDPVWGRDKQIALIESIFKNYYVPPLVFSVQNDPECNIPLRVCMDGKQRLTSLISFFDGQIPYKDANSRKSYYYTLPSKSRKKQLEVPERYKRIFASKKLRCVEFRGITDDAERDIFRRVQLGVTLTTAEKLAAISTPYSEWLRDLELKHVNNEQNGLSRYIQSSTARAKPFECLAQMIYCFEKLPGRTLPTSVKLHQWLSRLDPPTDRLQKDIEAVLTDFWVLATTSDLDDAFRKISAPVAPVEFVYIGILLAVIRECSEETKAEEVFKFRKTLRSKYKDVRANNLVIGSCWDIIEDASNLHGGQFSITEKEKKKRKRAPDIAEPRPTPISVLGIRPATKAKASNKKPKSSTNVIS